MKLCYKINKVSSRKHVICRKTGDDSFLYIIKVLCEEKPREDDRMKFIREFNGLYLCENLFHVSRETLYSMIGLMIQLESKFPIHGFEINAY